MGSIKPHAAPADTYDDIWSAQPMSAHASNVIRHAVCTRRSVDKGDEFSSCEAQFVTCRDFAKETGEPGLHWISERFDDEGRSGATLDRPAMRRLRRVIEEGNIHRVGNPTSEQDAWMPTWNSGSGNRVSMVFARATEVPWQEGLTNTLDRSGVSGYKFFGGSGGCRYGCRRD
ncbi:MAG TPA: recombinase family protein [Phycisphaerae bacterium]|nr:recombinase family protein [Phycisphaerae bacterium]